LGDESRDFVNPSIGGCERVSANGYFCSSGVVIYGRDQMLHWKAKLAYLLVAAAVLASFLGEAEGWHW
jgi:hypothetical protein